VFKNLTNTHEVTKGLPFSPEKAVNAKALTEGWTPPLFLLNFHPSDLFALQKAHLPSYGRQVFLTEK
jgi:hypothetical protein